MQIYTLAETQPCQHLTTQFLQAGCPSCRPTNSVKALKATQGPQNAKQMIFFLEIASVDMPYSANHTLHT